MASDKVIGIDLGTTNSCVAIVEDGTPSVIPNRGGYKTTPSMVAIAENGKRLVGHIAKRQAITNAENTVYAAKRLIGRKWGSAAVRSSLEIMPYRIVEGPHDDVRIMLRDQVFSVPEVSAYILQEMKLISEEYLGEEVQKAVVTVPAYFNDGQRVHPAGDEADLRGVSRRGSPEGGRHRSCVLQRRSASGDEGPGSHRRPRRHSHHQRADGGSARLRLRDDGHAREGGGTTEEQR